MCYAKPCLLLIILCSLGVSAPAQAEIHDGESTDESVEIVATSDQPKHRIGLKFRAFNNVKASFSGLGAYTPPAPVPPTATGLAKTYDDGFVGVDISGNAGGQTWNWGYNDASQYDPSGTGTMSFNQTDVIDGSGAVNDREAFNPGFEITYDYFLESREVSLFGKQLTVHPSFRASVGYVDIDIENSAASGVDLTRLTDVYQLNGVIPPLTLPYVGSFAGPGPLLGDTPTRTEQVLAGAGIITGSREISAHLIPVKFGPAATVDLNDKVAVDISLGATVAPIWGEFDLNETTTVPGVGANTRTLSEKESSILGGFYVDLGLAVQLNESWAVHASAGYQYLSDFDIESGGARAELDFGEVYTLGLGVSMRF